ncbi:efflux RND transporter periplasmic adaptor subunit [Treponema brennaborense]|uniref:Efflux transporter, RND family, MFP subunit n=1 Tax=Treponema brennaborense (strain DSM 12168 / CIP 105900 / DD5/3) TaxID=906968 RepID=F4LKK8_TREBD|nr:efflux RND transporter periplasmic adaptor subunit [Treponema brennaborense]AEE17564.1 efflux transporter, RND family, MFP subunit [Treponema brennaborense DSM 12168]
MTAKKRTRNGRTAALAVLTVCLIAAGTAAALVAARSANTAADANRTYTVTQETVKNIIEISGTVSAADEQTLKAAGDGTVTAVYVGEGDAVKKGTVLLQLDDTEQTYALAKHDYDIAQARISGSQRELELLTLQRLSLVKKRENRQIVANFDGVIAEFSAATGDYLEAKDSVGTIIDRSYLSASVEVVETDAPKLQAGQLVRCTFPAYDGGTITGYVVSYPAVGSVTSRGASIVKVKIRIDDPPESILPYYSFTGEIEISPEESLLLAAKEAVGREGGTQFVEKIKRDGTTERVTVTAEPYGSDFMRITEGSVAEGDVLKAQSAPRVSGTGKSAAGNTRQSTDKTENAQQSGFSLPGSGGAGVPGMSGGPGGSGGGMPPMR